MEAPEKITPTTDTIVMFLFKTARELYSEGLKNVKNDKELHEKFNDFKKDDLVVEVSMFRQKVDLTNVLDCVGLIQDWDEKNGEYIIKRLDNGEEVKWGNSKFVKVPIET